MSSEAKQLSLGLFFCRAPSFFAKLIRRVTGGDWSHCGLVFANVPGEQEPVMFEALWGRKVEKSPASKLHAWLLRTPKAAARVIPVEGLTENDVAAILAMARLYQGRAGYGELQILAMWASHRLGFRVPDSPDHVVCSELVARCLHPRRDVRPQGKDGLRKTFDEVTPQDVFAWATSEANRSQQP